MRSEGRGVLFVIGASVLFGAVTVTARIGYFYGAEPLSMLLGRNLIVAVALMAVLFASRKDFPVLARRQHLSLAGMGVLMAIFSYLYLGSVQFIPASLAVMLFYTFPALVALIGVASLGDRLTRARVVSLLMSTLGVGAMVGSSTAPYALPGVLLALLAAAVMAVLYTMAGALRQTVRPLETSIYTMSVAATTYAIAGLFIGGTNLNLSAPVWSVILATALLTVGGSLLFFLGIGLIGAARAAVASYVEPVVTIGLSSLVLSEGLGPIQAVGALLILVAIRLAREPVTQRSEPARPAPAVLSVDEDGTQVQPGAPS